MAEVKDCYIGKAEIAALFSSGWRAAARQLEKAGVPHINLGVGSGNGWRWYKPAVLAALAAINEQAKPKQKQKINKPVKSSANGLATMSCDEIYRRSQKPFFTATQKIQ